MDQRTKNCRAGAPWLSRLCCTAALTACAAEEPAAAPITLAERTQPFQTSAGGINPTDNHATVTAEGLYFLREDLAEEIAEWNELTDDADNPEGTKTNSIYHVDNCRVPEAFATLRSMYQVVVSALDPENPNLPLATQRFGTILHTVQDFYAHSNWVEGQGEVLVSKNEFEWPLVQDGTLLGSMMYFSSAGPAGASVSRRDGSRLPYVWLDGKQTKGLITGTYDNGDGSACHPGVSIPHGPFLPNAALLDYDEYLAKDAPLSDYHDAALRVAAEQTTEELCRLDRLVRLRHGDPGHALLVSEWVRDNRAFDSECAANPALVTSLWTSVL